MPSHLKKTDAKPLDLWLVPTKKVTKGFNIEGTELETFDGFSRQTVMTHKAAILQLVYTRNKTDAQSIAKVFNEEEQKVLKNVNEL